MTKITYLVPAKIGETDILKSQVYLSYIRADGEPDVVELIRSKEMYKEKYYQYTLPVKCKISKYPGEVVSWMQIFSGTKSNPTIIKSGQNIISVLESESLDGKVGDRFITALWATREDIKSKADGLSYNEDERELQLTSGGEKIGNMVKVPGDDYAGGGADEWDDIDDGTIPDESDWGNMDDDSGTAGDDEWGDM